MKLGDERNIEIGGVYKSNAEKGQFSSLNRMSLRLKSSKYLYSDVNIFCTQDPRVRLITERKFVD